MCLRVALILYVLFRVCCGSCIYGFTSFIKKIVYLYSFHISYWDSNYMCVRQFNILPQVLDDLQFSVSYVFACQLSDPSFCNQSTVKSVK